MITTQRQDVLASWLCRRIGLTPSPDIKCIGNLSADGKTLMGVVGFDGYNGSSVVMHAAGHARRWLDRSFLFAMFDYAFRVLDCSVVIGFVPSGNQDALRLNLHVGFRVLEEIKDAHPDGSLILMTMRREQCRYLDEARYGKKVKATSAS